MKVMIRKSLVIANRDGLGGWRIPKGSYMSRKSLVLASRDRIRELVILGRHLSVALVLWPAPGSCWGIRGR